MFFRKFFIGVFLFVGLSVVGYATTQADERNMLFVKDNALEVSLASHIYNRTSIDVNNTYQIDFLGTSNIVKLIKYKNDTYSGFTAGIYKVISGDNIGKVIIVFGGTTAGDRLDSTRQSISDILTDLNLLNFTKEDRQILQTRLFMDIFQSSPEASSNDIIIVGHSLGGGLAQYASMYSGIKALTINTAPLPISEVSQSYIVNSVTDIAASDLLTNTKYENQITNLMVPQDPLTSMLYMVEGYENGNSDQAERIQNFLKSYESNLWFQAIKATDAYLDDSVLKGQYNSIAESFLSLVAYGISKFSEDFGTTEGIDAFYLYKAFVKLKNNDIKGFIDNVKLTFGIPDVVKLKRLMIGKRVILPLNIIGVNAHLMGPLMDASSKYFNLYNTVAMAIISPLNIKNDNLYTDNVLDIAIHTINSVENTDIRKSLFNLKKYEAGEVEINSFLFQDIDTIEFGNSVDDNRLEDYIKSKLKLKAIKKDISHSRIGMDYIDYFVNQRIDEDFNSTYVNLENSYTQMLIDLNNEAIEDNRLTLGQSFYESSLNMWGILETVGLSGVKILSDITPSGQALKNYVGAVEEVTDIVENSTPEEIIKGVAIMTHLTRLGNDATSVLNKLARGQDTTSEYWKINDDINKLYHELNYMNSSLPSSFRSAESVTKAISQIQTYKMYQNVLDVFELNNVDKKLITFQMNYLAIDMIANLSSGLNNLLPALKNYRKLDTFISIAQNSAVILKQVHKNLSGIFSPSENPDTYGTIRNLNTAIQKEMNYAKVSSLFYNDVLHKLGQYYLDMYLGVDNIINQNGSEYEVVTKNLVREIVANHPRHYVEPNSTCTIKTYTDDDGKIINTFYLSGTISGNLLIESGTVYVNDYAHINGSLIHSGGDLVLGNGKLVIDRDYRGQTKEVDENGTVSYTYGKGLLEMMDKNGYMLVRGDFFQDSQYGGIERLTYKNRYGISWMGHYDHDFDIDVLTLGILEIKGDFTQKSSSITHASTGGEYPDQYYFHPEQNFQTSLNHRVVLSGTEKQTVSFEDSSSSYFTNLEIKNNSAEGVEFNTTVYVKNNISIDSGVVLNNQNNLILSTSGNINNGHWDDNLTLSTGTLSQDLVVEQDMTLNGTTDLNGQSLDVKGDLYINGNVNYNGATVTVSGDIYHNSGTVDLDASTLTFDGEYLLKGGTLKVNNADLHMSKDLLHSGGTLFLGNGQLTVDGDYRGETRNIDENGIVSYSYGQGYLNMTVSDGYMLVKGDFIQDSRYGGNARMQYHSRLGYGSWYTYDYDINILKNSTLELKGNFTQKSTSIFRNGKSTYYPEQNFQTSLNHRVVLSGTEKQTVSFEDSSSSYFTNLEIKNNSAEGVEFNTTVYVKNILSARECVYALDMSNLVYDNNNTEVEDICLDNDIDGDGVPNAEDAFLRDENESVDTDGDGIGNNADIDDDNDGILDENDTNATNPNEPVVGGNLDTDNDGIVDGIDPDDDNDGVLDGDDVNRTNPDSDGDGLNDFLDTNDTNPDTDGDGIVDGLDLNHTNPDIDGDGIVDGNDTNATNPDVPVVGGNLDTDNDGIVDGIDPDIDGDGVVNVQDAFPRDANEWLDTDNDGIGNNADTDDDGDGVLDNNDDLPLNPNESVDTDHDGVGNNADRDDDNDGISDEDENKWGFDPLDASDGGNTDTDGDGVSNADEIEAGSDPLDASDTKKPKRFVPIMMDDMVVMVPLVD